MQQINVVLFFVEFNFGSFRFVKESSKRGIYFGLWRIEKACVRACVRARVVVQVNRLLFSSSSSRLVVVVRESKGKGFA